MRSSGFPVEVVTGRDDRKVRGKPVGDWQFRTRQPIAGTGKLWRTVWPRRIAFHPGDSADCRPVSQLGQPGRLRRVVDRGWTIEYPEYAGDAPDALPRRIDIHRGDTRLRLIVDTWNP